MTWPVGHRLVEEQRLHLCMAHVPAYVRWCMDGCMCICSHAQLRVYIYIETMASYTRYVRASLAGSFRPGSKLCSCKPAKPVVGCLPGAL